MSQHRPAYPPPPALLTDLYQLTMAAGYLKAGMKDHEAVFHLFFRKNPFKGGYAIACGLRRAIELVNNFRFTREDLTYLATIEGNDGTPLFDEAFLAYLGELRFSCSIEAMPEGSVVFPHEPLLRIQGPLLQCQILETPLLNCLNFETLIATKSARVCQAALGDPVLEFGLRRAQGMDGGLSASRAAYVGGCAATSNLLAGKLFDIPVRGTHAHSWVMCFDSELESFQAYARAMPNNSIFLVDTYDTLDGVRRAAEAGQLLRARGHELGGIRLDSGDLAYLSIEARKILDAAGFPDAKIVASNDLDEHIITSLKRQKAAISVWGVGTRLATAFDQPALGGVYKLSAVRGPGASWQYKIKLSEQAVKVSNPGILQVRRFFLDNRPLADALFDVTHTSGGEWVIIDPLDVTRQKSIPAGTPSEDLLIPIFEEGKQVYEAPSAREARNKALTGLSGFHQGIRRFVHPHQYPVGLERRLHETKMDLIARARGLSNRRG